MSDDEIERYLRGTAASGELLRADDHLATCEVCRGRIDLAERIAAGTSSMREALRREAAPVDHPTPDEIARYVDGALDAVDREIVDAHLDACRSCAEDVADLRAVAGGGATRRASVWYTAAGLAAAAALAGLMLWTPRRPSDGREGASARTANRGRPSPAIVAPSIVLSLKDGNGTVVVDRDGTVAGLSSLAPGDRAIVTAALRDGRVDVSPTIAALRAREGTLLGAPATPQAFRPLQPIATAVETDQPRFEWTPVPGAASYIVSVFDAALDKVAESEPQSAPQWTPRTPLPRADAYSWQIRARTARGEVIAPAPPAPEARFLVLSKADADRVASLRRDYAASPLALGVLLARAGVLDEARRQLEIVVRANPASPEARQLLDSLNQDPSPTTRKPAQ